MKQPNDCKEMEDKFANLKGPCMTLNNHLDDGVDSLMISCVPFCSRLANMNAVYNL